MDVREQYIELVDCLNDDLTVMMKSVSLFVGSLYVKFVPENKSGGSNTNLIFDYNYNGTTETYYLKANETNWVTNPDAREVIAYLLLQHIGVGPSKCHFIPSVAQLQSVVYIATLKVC